MKYILGIDTSCYTTSFAGVSLKGEVLFNNQLMLPVPEGERGLQQSGALFQHLKNLPLITSAIRQSLPDGEIAAICSSTRPRPRKDSYMPVFLFSHHLGLALSDLTHTPFFKTSHQENHIMAGLYAAKGPDADRFLALHLSGGTSEMLDVVRNETGFDIHTIGASLDLHSGQFVDRIGVAMGLPFPAGPHLEKLASDGNGTVELTSSVKGLHISFSGPETQGQRLIQQGVPYPEIAYAVYQLLIRTISKWILHAVELGYPKDILLVGGVSSSKMLREGLQGRLAKRSKSIRLYCADPGLSKDNAVGTALLGLKAYKSYELRDTSYE